MQMLKESGYEVYTVSLDDTVRKRISGMGTGKKAEVIVHLFLRKAYGGQARVKRAADGADFRVEFQDGNSFGVEVTGTRESENLWAGLVVNSQQSYDALKSGEVVMFRVVDVDSEVPRIYVLEYGRDYYMEPEPRWVVKRSEPRRQRRYPFVGMAYRYDDPYKPVAWDDWDALK